jgi:DNA-binding transcriptional LysR family regulator
MFPGIAFRPLFLSAWVIAACKVHPLLKALTLQELQSTEWIRTAPLDSASLSAPQISVHCDSYHTGTANMASSDMLALMSRPAEMSILLCQAHEPIPDINHCLS